MARLVGVPGGVHEWAEVVEVHFFRPTGPAPDLKMSFTTAHRARRSAVRRQIVEYLRSAAFRISSRLKKYVLNAPGSAGTTLGPPFSRQNHQKSPRTVHTLARGAKRNRPDGAVGSAGGSCGSPGHVPLYATLVVQQNRAIAAGRVAQQGEGARSRIRD